MSGLVRPGMLLVMMGILTLLVACGRGGGEPEDLGPTANSDMVLSCSQECLERGQCGQLEDGSKMVLLVRSGPNVNFHDMAVAENTSVTVVGSQNRVLIETQSNTELTTDFYQVFVSSRNENAWVVSWCLKNP